MTSQRWTRIRPPISPFPHHLHPTFSPGPQQTRVSGGSPSPAKGVTPNPITPLHSSHTRTQTHTECSLIHANYIPPIKPSIYSFIPRMVCLFGTFISDPKRTNSLLSPPRVPILRSSHCSLITLGNPLLFPRHCE